MKAIILKKIASETDFKKRLETDINRIGYPMPIDTLDKRHLEGVAHKADSKEIVVTIPSGDIKVRWPDLSPVTLLAMHEYFTAKETNPEQAALRNRDAGVTAGCLGLTKESQALMDKASQKNPVLREEMPRSPQSKSPTPSPSPSPADTAMLKAEFDRNMPKFLLLLREFRWKQIPLNKIRTSNPDDEAQKTLLSKKVAREAEFQKRLVADINRIGYPLPVEKANKQRIEGAVRQATEEEIVVTVASGNLSLHWNDLSPSTLLAMHEYFTAKETNPEQLARRNWEAGVTAVCLGLTTEGQALMEKAAQKTPSLRDEMQLMLKP